MSHSDVLKRFDDMKSARQQFDTEWDLCDEQYDAPVLWDANKNEYVLNSRMEQNFTEMYVGRTSDSLIYDVTPDTYDVSQEQLERNRYILDYYLDKECFYDEYSYWRQSKARYGTWLFKCTLRNDFERKYELAKQTIDWERGDGIYSQNKLQETSVEKWFFTPQNMKIRHLFIDDRILNQPKFELAEDCVEIEVYTEDYFKELYSMIPGVDKSQVASVKAIMNEDAAYGLNNITGHVIVYRYYNRVTKELRIFANREHELLDMKMLYKFSWLPFAIAQHYPDDQCLYGIGVCKKLRSEKVHENNLSNYMMNAAKLSSMKVFRGTNNTSFVEWYPQLYPGEVNLLNFTSSVEQVSEVDMRVDMNGIMAWLDYINERKRENTNDDLKSPFEASDATLWQTEIKEQNKSIRYQAVDEKMYFALDRALTMTLSNIQQFAPIVLATYENVKGKKIRKKRPQIQLKNVKINRRNNTIEEDYGNYGMLELSPETIGWESLVRIITPSTYNRVQKTIEKNKAKELLESYSTFLWVAWQLWPEELQGVLDAYPLEKVIEKFKQSFGHDDDTFIADTKKAKQRKKNKKRVKEILASLWSTWLNAESDQETQGVQTSVWANNGGQAGAQQQTATGIESVSTPLQQGTNWVSWPGQVWLGF